MNKKIITATLILVLAITLLIITKKEPIKEKVILSPAAEQPSIIVAPKTYTLDSSTDLKKELDSINPQVLDSDFE